MRLNPYFGMYIILQTLGYYIWLFYWQDEQLVKAIGGNFFSILAPFTAFLVLFQTWLTSDKKGKIFWLWISLGCLSFSIGELMWAYFENMKRMEVPFPGWQDLFYILQIVFYLIAFIFKLVEKRENFRLVRFVFDILIIMTVASVFSWQYIIQYIFNDTKLSIALAISMSYPIGDLALLFGAASLYLGSKNIFPRKALFLLFSSLLIQICADSAFLYLTAQDRYVSGSLFDPLWTLAMLLMAQAGVYDLRSNSRVQHDDTKSALLDPIRLFLPYIAVIILLSFILANPKNLNIFIVSFGLTTILIITRQILTLLENQILLKKYNQLTDSLEQKVKERTEEVSVKNIELLESLERVEFLAYHDVLTGLPNRRMFELRLKDAISLAASKRTKVAVLFIDLDRFKNINDTFGHSFGDLLIKHVVSRLNGALRKQDTCSRQGGDELSIILEGVRTEQDVIDIVKQMQRNMAQPFRIGNREIHITPSIGIALSPDHGEEPELLIQFADMAMYRAKERGRNKFEFFTSDLSVLLARKLDLENGLRKAIEHQELKLYYQPQFNIHNGELIGLEALIRWNRTGVGMVSPAEFIPIAEETGLIVPIGEWIIQSACRQAKQWKDEGLPPMKMSVNLSLLQFHQENFVSYVAQVIEDTEVDPQLLDLEITESIAMNDIHEVIRKLNALKALGVRLSMDDFGTGFSSLSYLEKFPIDTLKIDQSFVRDISAEGDNEQIITAILAMAHSLHLNVLAEGVETMHQLSFLKELGCQEAQGYYFSKPLPPEEIPAFLNRAVS